MHQQVGLGGLVDSSESDTQKNWWPVRLRRALPVWLSGLSGFFGSSSLSG